MTYLRLVYLQPDPTDGSFDYFACGGSGHWAEHAPESGSDGFEVRGTSRKLLHARGESPSATGAATGAANHPAIQPDHCPASTGTDRHPAAFPHANHAIGISTDPAPTALHIPTLQAIHRMQQQTSPAPAMMPMMPQTPITQPQTTPPRDPAEYTQANFPSLTSRQLAVLAQLEMQDQQELRSSAHKILQPGLQTVAGESTGLGHTQPKHHLTPFGGRTGGTAPTSIRATHSTTRGEADAPSVSQGSQQKPRTATA